MPPAADKIILPDKREHGRNIMRVVLQIGIHGDNDITQCRPETRIKGGSLPAVLFETDYSDALIPLPQGIKLLRAFICGAVIDKNDLVRLADSLQDRRQRLIQRAQIFLFVKNRDHDR